MMGESQKSYTQVIMSMILIVTVVLVSYGLYRILSNRLSDNYPPVIRGDISPQNIENKIVKHIPVPVGNLPEMDVPVKSMPRVYYMSTS